MEHQFDDWSLRFLGDLISIHLIQNVYFEKHTTTEGKHSKQRSYSYTCDQEIYRLATLDCGQRWLVLNPIPNNKHQVIKFHLSRKQRDHKFN